jgi:hypothetical protein
MNNDINKLTFKQNTVACTNIAATAFKNNKHSFSRTQFLWLSGTNDKLCKETSMDGYSGVGTRIN